MPAVLLIYMPHIHRTRRYSEQKKARVSVDCYGALVREGKGQKTRVPRFRGLKELRLAGEDVFAAAPMGDMLHGVSIGYDGGTVTAIAGQA